MSFSHAGSVPSIPRPDSGPDLPPAADADWTIAGAVAFVLSVVAGAYLIGFGLAYGFLAWRYGFSAVFTTDAPTLQTSGAASRLSAVTLLVVEVLQLMLAVAVGARLRRDWWAALQLAWPRELRWTHWVGFLLLLFLVKAISTLLGAGLGSSAHEDLESFRDLFHDRTTRTLFLATVLLAGPIEEILFRGVLSRTLEGTRLGFWGGALAANLAFALMHTQYGIGGQVVVLAIGVTLSWIRARSGSIWPGAICHAANNGVAFLAMQAAG